MTVENMSTLCRETEPRLNANAASNLFSQGVEEASAIANNVIQNAKSVVCITYFHFK